MGWLSLCVCGTKRDSNDRKTKKDGKRKKSKKSKKNPKQKGSRKPPPFIVDEFLRKSQDELPKEIAEKEWTNGEIVNYLNDCAKNQIGSTDQTDPSKVNGSPSYQIGSDYERSFEKCFKNSERNASESARKPCDIDYDDNVMLHSSCASSTADENEKQVKCISDEGEHNEEELDESVPRPGELEDLSWTSEIEDRRDTESNFDRELGERISSRINFAKEEQGKSTAKASLKKKGARNILPPIKGLSRAEAYMDNEEELQAHGETNKFGFKKSAAFHERLEARRKLNSCSFEVRPFEDEERSGKMTRTRGEGSMIPRLASPLRQGMNLIKNDSDKSEIVQNGIEHIVAHKKLCTWDIEKLYAHRIFKKEKKIET